MAQATTLPAQVDRQPVTLREHLAKAQPEFARVLPNYIPAERFVRTTQSALTFTRNIDKVKNPQSLLAACMKAAADGLILDGREAALVVDHNGDVQYRPMMRGLLKLAYNSGEIRGIVVEVVRGGDIFRHSPTNLSQPVHHEINHEAERGEIHTVYAIAELKDGGIVHEVMSVEAVNRIRDRSDGWKAYKAGKIRSTPWHTDWSEMARKTVFRRLSKYLPSSSDKSSFHQAVERIDDDYTFDHEADAAQPATTQPARKKERGGAAKALAGMKDVTPRDAGGAPVKHDPKTGEANDDGPDQNDPRFSSEEQQDGDDI